MIHSGLSGKPALKNSPSNVAVCLCFVLGLIAGCTTTPDPTPLGTNSQADAHTSPRLYVLDCGSINFSDVAPFGLTNEETEVRKLVVPCYLIDHPEGTLLWDTGLPANFAGNSEPVELPGGGGMVTYKKSLKDQLNELGYATTDIDKIAFSHMHFDHTGSANLFTNSQLLIQQSEFTAAFEEAEKFEGVFLPELYKDMANARRRILNGDHDVFGDGSVQIISAPGHTPGHQVLQLSLANNGPLILSGDLYHFRFSREHRRTPVFNYNAEATLNSMDKVENLVKSLNAQFWIQHDSDLFDSLRKSPAYYD